jgi:hypothetical protein
MNIIEEYEAAISANMESFMGRFAKECDPDGTYGVSYLIERWWSSDCMMITYLPDNYHRITSTYTIKEFLEWIEDNE